MENKTKLVLYMLISLSVLLFDACKEEKEDINKYETQLVSGDNQTIPAGETSGPVVIRLKRGGKNFAVKGYHILSVSLPACNGASYTFSNKDFNSDFKFNTDGTAQFSFDAVSAPGAHVLTFTVKDLDENILGTQTIKYTVIPKTKGWLQTCYSNGFPIIKCNSNKLITYFLNLGIFQSVNEGKNWTPLDISNTRIFNQVVYDHWNNIIYALDYDLIHFSKDEGQTWDYISPFTPQQGYQSFPKPTREGKLVLKTGSSIATYDLVAKTYKEIMPLSFIKDFLETNNGHCYMLDDYGNIYHSSSLEGSYTKLSTGFYAYKIFTNFTNIYAISKNDVYTSGDNGQTWNKTGTIPDQINSLYESISTIVYSSPYFIVFDQYTNLSYRTSDFSSYELIADRVKVPYTPYHSCIFFDSGRILKPAKNGFIYVYEP